MQQCRGRLDIWECFVFSSQGLFSVTPAIKCTQIEALFSYTRIIERVSKSSQEVAEPWHCRRLCTVGTMVLYY